MPQQDSKPVAITGNSVSMDVHDKDFTLTYGTLDSGGHYILSSVLTPGEIRNVSLYVNEHSFTSTPSAHHTQNWPDDVVAAVDKAIGNIFKDKWLTEDEAQQAIDLQEKLIAYDAHWDGETKQALLNYAANIAGSDLDKDGKPNVNSRQSV
jgi:hypothetical protein